jgi:hypothetical protein
MKFIEAVTPSITFEPKGNNLRVFGSNLLQSSIVAVPISSILFPIPFSSTFAKIAPFINFVES